MGDRAIFVDDSNETRLSGELAFPESTPTDVLTVQADGSIAAAPGGGSLPAEWTVASNGGLQIETTDADTPAIEIDPPAGASAANKRVFVIRDDAGNLMAYVDAGGQWEIALNPDLAPEFHVTEGLDPDTSTITLFRVDSGGHDSTFRASPGGAAILFGVQTALAHKNVFSVSSVGGDDVTPAIGFFDKNVDEGTPAGQQTLNPATCTAEDIANVLIAYGLAKTP
jgi:hypothetical protein